MTLRLEVIFDVTFRLLFIVEEKVISGEMNDNTSGIDNIVLVPGNPPTLNGWLNKRFMDRE